MPPLCKKYTYSFKKWGFCPEGPISKAFKMKSLFQLEKIQPQTFPKWENHFHFGKKPSVSLSSDLARSISAKVKCCTMAVTTQAMRLVRVLSNLAALIQLPK